MNPYAIHANDITHLQNEQDGSCPVVVYNGVTIRVIPGSVENNLKLRQGGVSDVVDLSFTANAGQFIDGVNITDAGTLAATVQNKIIYYNGFAYKTDRVTILPGALTVMLHCNSLNQNA